MLLNCHLIVVDALEEEKLLGEGRDSLLQLSLFELFRVHAGRSESRAEKFLRQLLLRHGILRLHHTEVRCRCLLSH